jgi:hypothetical protein
MRKILFAGLAAAALMGGAAVSSTAGAQPTVVVEERYGRWDPAWGVTPPPPLPAWSYWRGEHEREWYGHVHNCMVRYQRYDPARDMYYEGHRWVSCRDRDRD